MTRRVEYDHEAVLESITFILGVTAKKLFSAHLEFAKKKLNKKSFGNVCGYKKLR